MAGDEPEIAAKRAQATTAARSIPPYQCPTIDDAKRIMRRATPPRVRKFPARTKNGIDMISNFSMPVNSFGAMVTDIRVISRSARIRKMMTAVKLPTCGPLSELGRTLEREIAQKSHRKVAMRLALQPAQPAVHADNDSMFLAEKVAHRLLVRLRKAILMRELYIDRPVRRR